MADLLVLIYKTWKKNTCKEIEVILNSIKGKTETLCRCENTLQLMGRAFKHNRKHKNGFSFVLLNLVASYYSWWVLLWWAVKKENQALLPSANVLLSSIISEEIWYHGHRKTNKKHKIKLLWTWNAIKRICTPQKIYIFFPLFTAAFVKTKTKKKPTTFTISDQLLAFLISL